MLMKEKEFAVTEKNCKFADVLTPIGRDREIRLQQAGN